MFLGGTSAVNSPARKRCKAIRSVHVIYIFLMLRLILEQNLCAICGTAPLPSVNYLLTSTVFNIIFSPMHPYEDILSKVSFLFRFL